MIIHIWFFLWKKLFDKDDDDDMHMIVKIILKPWLEIQYLQVLFFLFFWWKKCILYHEVPTNLNQGLDEGMEELLMGMLSLTRLVGLLCQSLPHYLEIQYLC